MALQEAKTFANQAQELTRKLHEWEVSLTAAQRAVARAETLVAHNEEIIAEELRDRVRAIRVRLDLENKDRQLIVLHEHLRIEQSKPVLPQVW